MAPVATDDDDLLEVDPWKFLAAQCVKMEPEKVKTHIYWETVGSLPAVQPEAGAIELKEKISETQESLPEPEMDPLVRALY